MEPFVPFKAEDLETIQKYEVLAVNFKRLLSQIFTQVAIDYQILVGKAQNHGPFSGWHFKMRNYRCWFGVCFKDKNFLGTRFQIQVAEMKPEFVDILKEKGYAKIVWDRASWMSKEQPTQAFQIQDRVGQVKVFRDIADSHLTVVSTVEAQIEAGGSIPLTPIN